MQPWWLRLVKNGDTEHCMNYKVVDNGRHALLNPDMEVDFLENIAYLLYSEHCD